MGLGGAHQLAQRERAAQHARGAQRERRVEARQREPLGQRRARQIGPHVGGREHVAGADERARRLPRRLGVRDDAAARGHRAVGAERDDRRRHEPRERDGGLLRIALPRQQRRLARVHDERAGRADQLLGPARRSGAPGRCRRSRRCAARPDRRGFPRCRRSRRAAPAARRRPRAAGARRPTCTNARSPVARERDAHRRAHARAGRSSRRPRRPAARSAASRGRPGRRARRAPRAGRARLQAMATLQAPPGATSERAACASSPCAGRASSPSRMTSTLAAPTHATSCDRHVISARRPSRAARGSRSRGSGRGTPGCPRSRARSRARAPSRRRRRSSRA